ncbi:major facilitator superfamily protein-1 [Coleophoma crateriformis]|uniref:Major facilitator superfamily protein-1 n=1 Tax=Coleophoma crateriformis TaxID=565419 RepID=A0A3D8T8W3_9HELO|nr:major facilitator superfamily protein-1 [Coleophoma crateriformis]
MASSATIGSSDASPRQTSSLSDTSKNPNCENMEEKLPQVPAPAPIEGYDRQFEVSFSGEEDPESPWSMSTARKWLIMSIVFMTSLCVACMSSIFSATYAQIEAEFHTSQIVATLGLSVFVFGLGLSPMVLAPLSEFYGRSPVYLLSMLFFVVWAVPCAVARNIQTLLIARFFDGFAGAAFLSIAGGTVGDLFPRSKLQAPMMIYTAAPFLGPELGPVIGGFINSYLDWRWTFYIMIIWASVQWALLCLLVPETYHPVLLRKKARKLRKETGDGRWHASIEKLNRSVAQLRLMKRREEQGGEPGGSEPEFCLPPAIVGAPLVTFGILWFGWTTYPSIHWIVSIIGSTFFSCGVILVFSGVFTFLVHAYPTYAASALAAHSFARSMFAGGFPLFGTALYDNLGFQWASFLLAMITLVMVPFP